MGQQEQEFKISVSVPKEIKRDIGNVKQVQVDVEETKEDLLGVREFITKSLLKKLRKGVFGKQDIELRKKECDTKSNAGKRRVNLRKN